MNQILPYIFFLACPISMGVMMWVMMRGMKGGQTEQKPGDSRIDYLEQEVRALRATRREPESTKIN